jgi:hypothetical protein
MAVQFAWSDTAEWSAPTWMKNNSKSNEKFLKKIFKEETVSRFRLQVLKLY